MLRVHAGWIRRFGNDRSFDAALIERAQVVAGTALSDSRRVEQILDVRLHLVHRQAVLADAAGVTGVLARHALRKWERTIVAIQFPSPRRTAATSHQRVTCKRQGDGAPRRLGDPGPGYST